MTPAPLAFRGDMTPGRRRRRTTESLVIALSIALLAGPATSAQGFSGPWESGHEPPLLTNPGVTVGVSTEKFELVISPSLWCPDKQHLVPLTVTFSDSSGTSSVTATLQTSVAVGLFAERQCEGNLTWEWSEAAKGPDFVLSGSPGSIGKSTNASVTFDYPLAEAGIKPLFYEVSGPSGVIAQAAMIATGRGVGTQSTETKLHDITLCEQQHLDIISGPGGELYCWVPGTYTKYEYVFSQGGWPAPAVPTSPAPAAPELPTLGASESGRYVRLALQKYKHKLRQPFRSLTSRCKRASRTRFKCSPSFVAQDVRWSGTAQIWLAFRGQEVWWEYSLNLRGYPQGCRRSACAQSLVVH
jgi:hypothetical protein